MEEAGKPGQGEKQPETPSSERTVRNEFRRKNRLIVERIHVDFLRAGWL
jgi:hypothetical protein